MSYGIPPGLAWVADQAVADVAPVLYLMHVPDGVPLVLTDTAALIWLFAVESEDVVEALTEVIADPPPDLADTTYAYIGDLVTRGLLLREDTA